MMNQEKIQELIVRSRREDTNAFSLLLSEFQ
ncbi:MAG: RNA polymerase subunit sigma-70, partial [Bacteroides cellulosilyticus]|nr:RNA polymerase subunit sigma-70 [Bacteroides cellulosilyticus]